MAFLLESNKFHDVFRRDSLHYTSKHRVCDTKHSLSGAYPLKPQPNGRKDVFKMSELLFFIIGLFIGGLCGIVVMSLMQINHIYDKGDKNK
jgi:hypothetical protein